MDIKTWAKRIGEAQKDEAFQLMLWVNPDLKVEYKKAPDTFTGYFISLQAVLAEPAVSDPNVLGGYMRRMVENPLYAVNTLSQACKDWGR